MNHGSEPELGNSILAVIGGACVTFLAGLVLYPVEQAVADQFFEFSFSDAGFSINMLVFEASIIIWISVATFLGGLACARICRSYEYKHITVLAGIAGFIYFLMIADDPPRAKDMVFFLFLIPCNIGAFYWGASVIVKRRKKQAELAQLNFDDDDVR